MSDVTVKILKDSYELSETYTIIGSTVSSIVHQPISIENPMLSERHAVIEKNNSGCRIIDLCSDTGTFVDGKRLEPLVWQQVNSMSEVLIGTIELNFRFHASQHNQVLDVLYDSDEAEIQSSQEERLSRYRNKSKGQKCINRRFTEQVSTQLIDDYNQSHIPDISIEIPATQTETLTNYNEDSDESINLNFEDEPTLVDKHQSQTVLSIVDTSERSFMSDENASIFTNITKNKNDDLSVSKNEEDLLNSDNFPSSLQNEPDFRGFSNKKILDESTTKSINLFRLPTPCTVSIGSNGSSKGITTQNCNASKKKFIFKKKLSLSNSSATLSDSQSNNIFSVSTQKLLDSNKKERGKENLAAANIVVSVKSEEDLPATQIFVVPEAIKKLLATNEIFTADTQTIPPKPDENAEADSDEQLTQVFQPSHAINKLILAAAESSNNDVNVRETITSQPVLPLSQISHSVSFETATPDLDFLKLPAQKKNQRENKKLTTLSKKTLLEESSDEDVDDKLSSKHDADEIMQYGKSVSKKSVRKSARSTKINKNLAETSPIAKREPSRRTSKRKNVEPKETIEKKSKPSSSQHRNSKHNSSNDSSKSNSSSASAFHLIKNCEVTINRSDQIKQLITNSEKCIVPAKGAAAQISFTRVDSVPFVETINKIGGRICQDPKLCSVLVTNKVTLTWKFLCACAKGVAIVAEDWLQQSKLSKVVLDPEKYLISDYMAEKNYKFRLKDTLAKARKQQILTGYVVFVTANTKPTPDEFDDIIACAGGHCIRILGIEACNSLTELVPAETERVIAVSDVQDKTVWQAIRRVYPHIKVFNSQGMIHIILRYDLNMVKYLLH